MPVNYPQIQQQIREMGEQVSQNQPEQKERLEWARAVLNQYAGDLAGLNRLVDLAAEQFPNLRCAAPLTDPLNYVFGPPADTQRPVILAADGSQITPSHHDAVEYGMINIGVFRICPGGGLAPSEIVRSELLYEERLERDEPLTEESIAMMRDLKERNVLVELAAREPQPVLTLTDGTLELSHEPQTDRRFERHLEEYLDVLERLAGMNVATAGYVDKPRADLLVRLLELVLLRERPSDFGHEHPLRGVRDAMLLGNCLQPGQRSAVFRLQFKIADRYAARLGGRMALHFFYLNVSSTARPLIARVEVPAWVSNQPYLLNIVHAALLEQSRAIGAHSYPYALHRAHEIAVIGYHEKQQITDLIRAELLKNGLGWFDYSNKQFNKDLERRTRR